MWTPASIVRTRNITDPWPATVAGFHESNRLAPMIRTMTVRYEAFRVGETCRIRAGHGTTTVDRSPAVTIIAARLRQPRAASNTSSVVAMAVASHALLEKVRNRPARQAINPTRSKTSVDALSRSERRASSTPINSGTAMASDSPSRPTLP